MDKKLIFVSYDISDAADPRIVRLSVNFIDDGKIITSLVDPQHPISIHQMSLHNITNEMVSGKPTLDSTPAYILMRMEPNAIIVGHGIDKINIIIKNSGGEPLPNQIIDTHKCLYHATPEEWRSYKLNFVRYALEFDKLNPDADKNDYGYRTILTKNLFDYLMDEDEMTIDDMLMITRNPLIYKKFTFGKYSGKYIDVIAKEDYQYLKWMLDNEMKKVKTNAGDDQTPELLKELFKRNNLIASLLYYIEKHKPEEKKD
ncbi:3'-5' exonuclease [Yersinia phage vB_Yru_GN1]|uniref:3'-5' exonuclease n=1 Tax=Yersinia phage vB_Yru_GN1 TaxID=3074381 RepID=A0AA86JCT2_9CAUD|nr:3'-5' exonuclease [Yersinia phage vB_Yru_GN1]